MKENDSQECLGGRNKVAIKTAFIFTNADVNPPPPAMSVQPVQCVRGSPGVPVAVLQQLASAQCPILQYLLLLSFEQTTSKSPFLPPHLFAEIKELFFFFRNSKACSLES